MRRLEIDPLVAAMCLRSPLAVSTIVSRHTHSSKRSGRLSRHFRISGLHQCQEAFASLVAERSDLIDAEVAAGLC